MNTTPDPDNDIDSLEKGKKRKRVSAKEDRIVIDSSALPTREVDDGEELQGLSIVGVADQNELEKSVMAQVSSIFLKSFLNWTFLYPIFYWEKRFI